MEGNSTMIRLTNNNWQIWKSKMEDILYCKDLYEPVEGDSAKPEEMTDADWTKCNRKAVGTIRQWLDDSVYHHVASETSAHELWKKLESLYEQKTAANKAFLIRKLVNLKFREGTSVAEHLNEFQSLINQLSAMKMTLEDELQALLLLGSLPDSWETLVVTISNAAPNDVVTMSTVTSSLFNEETRRKSTDTKNISSNTSMPSSGSSQSSFGLGAPTGSVFGTKPAQPESTGTQLNLQSQSLNMEDSMVDDTNQVPTPNPPVPVFGQTGSLFGAPSGAPAPGFQFGAQLSQSLFQLGSNLEFNVGYQAVSGSGAGGDKPNRRIVKVSRTKPRRK